jgi:predicted ATPase
MRVAVCGSQGSGKSTILKALHSLGFNSIEGKVARSILHDWDTSLSDVYNDVGKTKRFQEEILVRKLQETHDLIPGTVTFFERTFADVFVYCLLNIGKCNEYSEWFVDYYNKCKAAQQEYDLIFYLPSSVFPVENDGVRPYNKFYSHTIDIILTHYLTEMSPCPIVVLDCESVDERVCTILSTIESMNFNLT